MNATIISRTPTSFTLQVEIPYSDSKLDFEDALQERLNDAGVVATAEGLQQFDTDGSPINVGRSSSPPRARSRRTTRPPTVSPPSPGMSTRAPRAARPTARSTGTP